MTPRRIIRLAREPAPAPTAPPANVPIKDLHNAASPERMAQLIVPSASIEHSRGNAFALEPGVVDVFLDLEANFLHDVDFDLVTPGDAPGTAVLSCILRAGGADAGAGAIDCVLFHGCSCLCLVLIAHVEL